MDNYNNIKEYKLEQSDKEENINKFGKKKKQNQKGILFPLLITVFSIIIILSLFYFYYKSKNINKYNFIAISNKKDYFNVTFENKNDYIKINVNHKIKFYTEEYEKIFNLNEIKKFQYFSLDNSIEDIYKKLIENLMKNNYKIKKQNNQINIVIPIKEINIKEINIVIPLKIKNKKELNNKLLNEFIYLNEENNLLQYELNYLNERNNILNEDINKYLKSLKALGEQTSELINLLENNKIFELSSIINNDIEKIKILINWIKQKTKKNIIKLNLIFKMSENGSSSNDFHKYCDNQGPTLLIIETKDEKIFGGFTPLNWKFCQKIERIIDFSDLTFLFSLNLMKKLDMINKNDYAIRNDKDFGPIFGNFDLSLSQNMTRGGSFANNLCNFFSNNYLELTGENGVTTDFQVKEFEVYKVIY